MMQPDDHDGPKPSDNDATASYRTVREDGQGGRWDSGTLVSVQVTCVGHCCQSQSGSGPPSGRRPGDGVLLLDKGLTNLYPWNRHVSQSHVVHSWLETD